MAKFSLGVTNTHRIWYYSYVDLQQQGMYEFLEIQYKINKRISANEKHISRIFEKEHRPFFAWH